MTATSGSSATAATEARPRPVAAGRLRLNGGTMKLIPHHQDDKHGTREYRSPDGAWRVVRTRRPGGSGNARPRWEGSRALRGPRRRLASSRRLRAPAGRAGLPGHHGRSVGGRERHDSARQAARDPRTLAGTTPVQPRAGRRRGRSRTTSTRPAPRTRRLRAPTGRAGLPGHHGRSVGRRERHDSARQAARDPRTLAGTTPVQPAPDRRRGRSGSSTQKKRC